MQLDDELCYCFHISRRKIENFIRLRKPRRPSQVSECGGAGTGCGWCVPYLRRCFERAQQSGNISSEAITPEEYAQARAEYIAAGRGKPPG